MNRVTDKSSIHIIFKWFPRHFSQLKIHYINYYPAWWNLQRFCCLPFISKTFWHFPRKSSLSQLRQGTCFPFHFVTKHRITASRLETNSSVWRELRACCRGGTGSQEGAGPGDRVQGWQAPGVLLTWDESGTPIQY